MATKPRIPVFRSKLPGLQSASRLPRTKLSSRSSQEGSSSNEAVGGTLKSKYNSKAKNNRCEVTDNIRFIDKNGNRNNISAPKHEQITVVNSVHESSIESAQDIEENCEVVSLCSAEPSPNKSHHGYDLSVLRGCRSRFRSKETRKAVCRQIHLQLLIGVTGHSDKEENGNYSEFYLTGENGVEFEALAPDLIAFKRFQELSRTTSPTGSTVSNDSDNHTRARLPLPSSTFVKNKPKSVHSKTKPSNFGASKPKSLYQRGKEKRIGLPTKSTTISPSNAMDYVRQITNRSTSLEVKLARRRNEIKTEPTRKISAPARQGAKGDGKWTTDLDAAMNLNRRQSQPTIDES
uniref:Uncharacterized protein n=1 Tax=Ciona savignyi TaxID=51511 RepID=H2YTV4_CIOSA